MSEENGIKNITIIILLIIIAGLLFAMFDIVGDSRGVSKSDTQADENVIAEEELQVETDETSTAGTTQPPSEPATKGTPPSSTPAPVVQKMPPVVVEPGVVVVTYTDSGFIPPVIEVRAGGSVTFVNASSKPLWVTSENHPTAKAQLYRGFDQGKSMSSGETYTFNFTQVGVWGYKNLNLEKHLGAVSVISQ